MTLDKLIAELQEIRKQQRGDIEVELQPVSEPNEYGIIDSVGVVDSTEDEYDFQNDKDIIRTVATVQISFTKGFY